MKRGKARDYSYSKYDSASTAYSRFVKEIHQLNRML
jgi:hypothetical protein